MSTGEYGRLCQEFIEELKALARDRGVEREDDQLLELLNDRLQILCGVWSIDLASGAAEVRAEIRKRLDEHLSEITPVNLRPGVNSPYPKLRGAERKTQFERVIRVIFNVDPDLAHGFSETGTEDRMTWLTTPANRANGIDYSLHAAAAQRDYERARKKIAEALARRELIRTASASEVAGSAHRGASPATVTDEVEMPQHVEVPDSTAERISDTAIHSRYQFKRRAVVIGIVTLVLLSGSLVASRMVGDTKASAPKTQSPPSGPITVLAQYHDGDDSFWVIPQALGPGDTNRLNALGGDFNAWVPKMRGVLLAQSTYELTITGNDPNGVTITNISVDLVRRMPPLKGSLIAMSGQGVQESQGIRFNLDENPSVAIDVDPQSQFYDKPYFSKQTIPLAKNEPITFDVNVEALKYDYLFNLIFTMDVQGRLEKVKVSGPSGQPFQISGESTGYDAVFWPAENAISLRYVPSQEYCSLPHSLCIGSPQESPLS